MSVKVIDNSSKRQIYDLDDIISVPPKFYTHVTPKSEIGIAIHDALEKKGLSIRGYAESIGMQHHQLLKVLKSDKNYTIDTLLSILADLDLKISIEKK